MKILIFDGFYHWTVASALSAIAEFVSIGLSRLINFMLSDITLYKCMYRRCSSKTNSKRAPGEAN